MPVLLVLLRLAGLLVLAEGTSVLTRVNVRLSSMSSVLPQPHFQAEQCLEEPRREQLAPLVQPAPSVHRDEEEDGRAYARRLARDIAARSSSRRKASSSTSV